MKNIRLLCLCLCIGVVASLPGQESDVNKLARIWVDRAMSLLENRSLSLAELEQATQALDAAAEYRQPGPDSNYLRALLLLDERSPYIGNRVQASWELSRDALKHDEIPAMIGFDIRASLFGSLSLRLKKYRDYLNAYQNWPEGHKVSPTLLYVAARSAVYLGMFEKAAEWARYGEVLSEDNTDLSALNLNIYNAKASFRALRIVSNDPQAIQTFPSTMVLWGQEMEKALMPWILSGKISVSNLRQLSKNLSKDGQNNVRFILDGMSVPLEKFEGNLALARLVGRNISDDISIQKFSGLMTADAEYDGYVEESIQYLDGMPKSRYIDSDQDGVYDWVLEFENGQPFKITLDGGRLIINYVSGAYPEIHSIINTNELVRGEALFNPGMFNWKPATDPVYGQLNMPFWTDQSLYPMIRRITVEASRIGEEQSGKTITWLDKGYPVKAVEIRYQAADNRMVWRREILYKDGVVTTGRRSFKAISDQNPTPVWEIYERYENNKLVGLAWDPGMKGTPGYLKDWALGLYLQIQVWDVDADGWMDVRRFVSFDREDSQQLMVTEARASDIVPWQADSWYPWE